MVKREGGRRVLMALVVKLGRREEEAERGNEKGAEGVEEGGRS